MDVRAPCDKAALFWRVRVSCAHGFLLFDTHRLIQISNMVFFLCFTESGKSTFVQLGTKAKRLSSFRQTSPKGKPKGDVESIRFS